MLPSIFIIPDEFLFLIEVTKALYYYYIRAQMLIMILIFHFEIFVVKTYSFNRIDDGEFKTFYRVFFFLVLWESLNK